MGQRGPVNLREASEQLHKRARAFALAYERGESMPEPFDTLAVDLARFQARSVTPYARLLRAHGRSPDSLRVASDAPAVPTDAFKLARVAAFPEEDAVATFHTSGTTMHRPGVHAFRDIATYDCAALAFGRWALMAGGPPRVPVLCLGPSPREAPHSSLTHMMATFAGTFGTPATDAETYFIHDGVIDMEALDRRVAYAMMEGHRRLLLLGTTLAFVHLLEGLDEIVFRLPDESCVMQTGGSKGASVEVDGDRLVERMASVFAIDARRVISEYGMTELSSQFYEPMLHAPASARAVYSEPPWARVIPVDPDTLEPLPDGEVGIARIEDLMNVDSAFAILTADRVRRVPGGFELLGRQKGAPPRGCSISVDEMLSD